ncbi:MAG: hypothetical protein NC084_13665 [Bacteroides sp.]|nr:hypothetical protein [Eubacterium sp.]MCM1419749.1 hypothetical protein [Roseburia sp.]MCM1463744.1 hypothetical protein [Bacteroides sp.]
MIDIKPWIAGKLGDLAPIELSFGRVGRKLPVITITETENSARVVLNGAERISRITLQLDAYAPSAEETEALAARINERLTAAGLKRSFSQLMTDGDVPRRCMRYTCGADEVEGRIVTL